MTGLAMTPHAPTVATKQRILYAGAELFGRQGYAGTGLKQVSAAAQAPFGSLYHHFPGGKEDLGDDVIRQAGAFFLALVESVFVAEPDPVAGIRAVFDGAAQTVRSTGYQDACPIAAIALEVASTNERLRVATADVFASWIAGATTWFAAAGLPHARSRELAITTIAALEGGFLLARATRDTTALELTGNLIANTVAQELAGR